ncbi:MAG: hypothetical protein JRH11_21260 [Deltaproteobacteria bacterium]|nr:hypothetical protein [Deltaproteobacteria bacterium]
MGPFVTCAALCGAVLVAATMAGGCSNDGTHAADSGVGADATPADGGEADTSRAPDTSDEPLEDAATPEAGLGGRWLEAVAELSAEFCRCEITVRDYTTADECALAEGSTAGVRACADAAMAAHSSRLSDGFQCITEATEAQAACFRAQASCDVDALNACEAVAGPTIAACPGTPVDALDAFFAAIGECVRGSAGGCADLTATEGTGVIARGNTVGAGNDFSASCAAGGDVAPDVAIAWTAPASGTYRFDTFGSAFDTQLLALVSCDGGAPLGCNDDAGDRRTSEIELTVTAGDTIVLVVDGFDELSAGDFVLNATPL